MIARIIPARAGFTLPARRKRHRGWDHPRSRGVYDCCSLIIIDRWGSSPLARGLRRIFGDFMPFNGIIPARAGFTPNR